MEKEEKDENGVKKWGFQGNEELNASAISVRGMFFMLMANLNEQDERPMVRLCRADPTESPSFRTTQVSSDAIASAVRSFNFNGYPPNVGLLEARRLVILISIFIYRTLFMIHIAHHVFDQMPSPYSKFVITKQRLYNVYRF